VLPCAQTVPMLLWALLASGQIQMRKVDGWETLSQPIEPMPLSIAFGVVRFWKHFSCPPLLSS
jgi:hypothetical protein